MALFAFHLDMFSGQRKSGLPVVIIRLGPRFFGMAGLAIIAQLPLVLVVFLVAFVTTCRRLGPVQVSLVAAVAFCRRAMLPEQRILGPLVMVEGGVFPIPLDVAAFALRAEAALVLVILLVARVAGRLELFPVQISLVTAGAFCRRAMLPEQRIPGSLVVVERDALPVPLDVAGFALRTEFALVLVVFLVAGAALFRRIFELLPDVAADALHVRMLAQQPVAGFIVIEVCGLPVFLRVAFRAILAQSALMLVVLLVATVTGACRFPVFCLGGVAVLALDFCIQVRAP